jgi:hypothetical protein
MSFESSASGDPAAALSAFFRVLWREVVSLFVLSVLFVVAAMSVLTIGPAMLSLVDTYYSSVTFTGTGGGVSRRTPDRANHFVKNIWTYLRTGLVYTLVLLVAVAGLYLYFRLALFGDTLPTFVVGVVGLYATIFALVLVYRAANVVVHAEDADDEQPGFRSAVGEAWGTFKRDPAYAAVHLVVAAAIVVVCRISIIALAIPLPALLALLEVVLYEELDGIGAKTLVYAYKDPQS